MDNFSRELKCRKENEIKIIELKSKITKIENTTEKLNSR